MDEKEKSKEKHISMLELEDEELSKELSVEEKKAAIRSAKQTYGKDWKKILFGAVKGLRLNRETMHTLHGLGMDSSLKRYNDPRSLSKSRGVEEAFKE